MTYLGLESIRRGNTAQCVKDIFTLHFPNALTVLDATYGKGRFWNWDHNLQVTGVDIAPQDNHIVKADYRQLPFTEAAFHVICFDPMFIFTPGIGRVMGTKRFFKWSPDANEQMLARPRNPADLLEHYRRIFEQRHLATQGLIVKGQDLIVNRPDWWSFHVYNLALEMGMGEPADILIQHSPAARMKDPRWNNQRNFRRAHCFYIIYKW